LLDAIVEARGGSRAYHATQALIKYATEEEVEKAGLIE
jgi:predicted transcriptional regulator